MLLIWIVLVFAPVVVGWNVTINVVVPDAPTVPAGAVVTAKSEFVPEMPVIFSVAFPGLLIVKLLVLVRVELPRSTFVIVVVPPSVMSVTLISEPIPVPDRAAVGDPAVLFTVSVADLAP